jgi:NAD+ kinase
LDELGVQAWTVDGPQNAFDAADADLVITVGGDGTLLAASHNIGDIPILGVNSAPDHSIGFFCAATKRTVAELVRSALTGKARRVVLARMQVEVEGRAVSTRVLNEALFCHEIPAATTKYILRYGARREEQRSSGLWVGTAAGSTGALRSAGGRILPLKSQHLQVVVREPYQGEAQPYRMQKLIIESGRELSVVNKMNEGWMFLDGPFKRVRVRLGETIRFSVSKEPLTVLGLDPRRPRKR